MYTLFASIIVVVLGLLAMAYSTYTLRTLDNTLSRFGSWSQPLKWALLILGGMLFVSGVVAIVMYFKTGQMGSPLEVYMSNNKGGINSADYFSSQLQTIETGAVGEDAMTDKGFGKIKSVLANQTDQKTVTQNGIQGVFVGGANMLPDNILTKFWLPQFTFVDPDHCSRTIKPYGNCQGVSRHFRDELRTVNGCNKIHVTSPQSIPFIGMTNIPF